MPHPDLDRFEQLYRLADRVIAEASKDELAEGARILALNLAQYQGKYGELPAQEYVALSSAESLSPETVKTLGDGMEILVGVLGTLAGEDEQDNPSH